MQTGESKEARHDAFDRLRRRVLWSLPSGLYLLGSAGGERRNLMTLSWAMQVAIDPKLVAVSVEKEALTLRLVEEGRAFSVNLLRREDRQIVRRFAKPAEEGEGTLGGLEVFSARTGAPILTQAAGWLDCELRYTQPLGSHTLFVGEVVDCGLSGDDAGPLLRMED
ncbi:MAG: flavin reductase family protein, partial [Acidimicrobiales bacterium]